MSFDCPNSTYEILLKKKNTENDLAMLIQGKFEAKCGIVYWVFKHNSEKLVQKFKDNFNINAMHHHAGLDKEDRHFS